MNYRTKKKSLENPTQNIEMPIPNHSIQKLNFLELIKEELLTPSSSSSGLHKLFA